MASTHSSSSSATPATAPDPADRALVETLALALVREYLAKRKYKATLDTLQNELPIKPTPTTTTALAKSLGISKFVAANAKSSAPYPTLLDIFAQFMYDRYGREANAAAGAGEEEKPRSSSKSSSSSTGERSSSSSKSRQSAPEDSEDADLSRQLARSSLARPNSLTSSAAPSASSSRSGSSAASSASSAASSARSSSSRPDSGSGSSASAGFSSSSAAAGRPGSASRTGRDGASAAAPSFAGSSSKSGSSSSGSSKRSEPDDSDLMLEEDVDVDAEIESYDARTKASGSVSFSKPGASSLFSGSGASASASGAGSSGAAAAVFATTPVPPSTPLSLDEAHKAKSLIFGASHLTGTFTDPWLSQGFFFKGADVTSSVPSLGFGLVQAQGGPCGCLAVVQAYVIKELLFSGASANVAPAKRYELLAPSASTLAKALVHALADILWMCGDGRAVKCCVRDPRAARMTSARKMSDGAVFKPDGISECMAVVTLTSLAAVRNFFAVNHASYTAAQGSGVVLFLYSVILTRGLDEIRSDRDENSSLIGAHSYCTQEMVNLMLTGRARSNVFDGTKDLGGLLLRGIDRRSTIGFLSLFEHYENIEVGSFLKQPLYPIWVVCSESHYTVAFSLDASLTTKVPECGKFDLFYYDELAKQREEIKLSIDLTKKSPAPKDGDLEPPINECLRTKWGKHARIDWNGVEPIL